MISFLEDSAPVCGVDGLEDFFSYAVTVVRVIQIVVPIALIIWGSIDLLKGVIAGDDKKVKEARKPFIQRFISAILVFLIPWILNYALSAFSDGSGGWADCYSAAAKKVGNQGNNKPSSDPASYAGTKSE